MLNNNPNITIYNDDAYSIVNRFIEEKIFVNHIITDPPYNISKENNFHTMKHPRAGVDFGVWDQGKFDLFSWIPLYSKILDKNGSMVIFCSYRFLSYIIDTLESPEAGMEVKDIIVWQKSNPMPRNINRRYVQDMEFAIWAVKKGAKWIFNKGDVSYRRSLFQTPLVSGKEKVGHPTQKSLKLMEDIIAIHSNPNELILDPFMGSGSTGVAALKNGRRFIGIEKEKTYFDLVLKRMEEFCI